MPSSAEVPVREYVARFSPEVRRLIGALRRLVRSVAPDAAEKADRGWPIRFSTEPPRIEEKPREPGHWPA